MPCQETDEESIHGRQKDQQVVLRWRHRLRPGRREQQSREAASQYESQEGIHAAARLHAG
jgi:hypothetical protein